MSSTTLAADAMEGVPEWTPSAGQPIPTLQRSLLWADVEMDTPHLVAVAGGIATAFSTRSPGKETANEDAAAIVPLSPTRAVLIVADGLGGHAGGEQASRLAVSTIVDFLQSVEISQEDDDSLRPAILNGMEAANEAVRQIGGGAATTMAIAAVEENRVRAYHVGDSVILLTGQRGKVKQRTIPHSPVGYAVEAGLVAEEDAIHHEDLHVISNVMGSDEMRIEIGPPIEMARRDTLLLATDGLLDNLLFDEIVSHIRKGLLGPATGRMIEQALARMRSEDGSAPSKPDDLTMIAFRRQ